MDSLDQMVQRCLLALRTRGGVVSRTIAIVTARALIARIPQYNLGHVKMILLGHRVYSEEWIQEENENNRKG